MLHSKGRLLALLSTKYRQVFKANRNQPKWSPLPFLTSLATGHCLALASVKKLEGTNQGILKGKYHCTVDLLFDWFGLLCFAKKKIVSSHTADFKRVKLLPLVFPGQTL